jgi:hypothetical protein
MSQLTKGAERNKKNQARNGGNALIYWHKVGGSNG